MSIWNKMEKLLFTSESVTEGHPDKICAPNLQNAANVSLMMPHRVCKSSSYNKKESSNG